MSESHFLLRKPTRSRGLPFPGLRGKAITQGGATESAADASEYDPERGGYAVGTSRIRVRPGRKLGPHHRAQREIAKRNTGYAGVWKDEKGVFHYDPTKVVESEEEARALGAEHKQIAIWDFKNQREIRL